MIKKMKLVQNMNHPGLRLFSWKDINLTFDDWFDKNQMEFLDYIWEEASQRTFDFLDESKQLSMF